MSTVETTSSPPAGVREGALISETLADFSVGLSYEDIPKKIRERAKHLMLDAVGIGLASTRWEFGHKTLSAIRGLSGPGDCTVVGMPDRLPLRDAVLVNGVLVHGLDYDDTHVPGIIHATASALPCALGVAEHVDATGKELLAAYVVAVETSARLAAAAQGGFHHVGFHPTGLVGAFGCALAAGRLMEANALQLVMAQGIALSTGAGSQEFLEEGAWTKRMHPGWAGVGGITAAALARQGFLAPRRAYEGRFGLFAIHLGPQIEGVNYALATAGLGETWEIDQVAVKPFPACHFTHACADAALELTREHGLQPEAIDRVRAFVPEETIPIIAEPVEKKRRPVSDYDAKFSVQFIVAASILRGRFGLGELEPEALNDPRILALADRVDYAPYPDSAFPQAYSGGVSIALRDGGRLERMERINRGAADRPLSNGEVVQKFMDNAQRAVSRRRAEAVREAMLGMDTRSAREVAAVLGGT